MTTTASVVVEVPATSANLGPGFDSLGIALDWSLRLRFTVRDHAVLAPIEPIARLAAQAALTLYARAELPRPAGLEVTVETADLPVGRGLGLSAAARVGGLLAANALIEGGYDREALLPLAVQLEHHGDNAAPAMFGGLQVIVEDDEHALVHLGLSPPEELRLVLLVPELSMPTEETRKQLPERLTRNQAVHNIGRAALLIGALQARRYDLLNVATEDVLHQPTRATIFEPMYSIFQAARDAGAHGVYLSGGGPTIAAFATEGFDDIAGAMREAAAVRGVDAIARVTALRQTGAKVLDAADAPAAS
ncbi:MAG: homoserine kinase [Chloroflexi bacterium]|nr:homoserine kinase [Chloroflexota bacterium]